MEVVQLALAFALGIIAAFILLAAVVKYSNQRDLAKATGLTKAQRDLNRAAHRMALEVVSGAFLEHVELSEDAVYSYTRFYFSNGYTVTVAAVHGKTSIVVAATNEVVGAA